MTVKTVKPKTRRRLSDQPRTILHRDRGKTRAVMDAAATTRLNQQHWSHAVSGEFNSLMQLDAATVMYRTRYEMANNSYAAGIAETLALDVVGTGPRPQVDSGNEAFDQEIEELFCQWCLDCDYAGQMDLAELLQMQMVTQQCDSGNSLTLFKRADVGRRRQVSLRLLPVDIERLANPIKFGFETERLHDGIAFDAAGRPTDYYILKHHPASPYIASGIYGDHDVIPADQMVHLFRIRRPGQFRGTPWFAPVIELFAQLRRFTAATLDAAETAADIAGTLEAENLESTTDYEVNDVVELERKHLLVTPPGYKMNQVRPEHPSTTYPMFKNEIINEIARCVLMPFNVAAMNSARYNYASGRLDHQKYHRMIETLRHWGEARMLRRVFAAFAEEAYLLGLFTTRPTFDQLAAAVLRLRWFWPGFKHVDPVKEAQADRLHLEDGTTTLEDIYAEKGQDWKRKLIQRSKEIKLAAELGLPTASAVKIETPKDDNDDDTPKDDDE